MMKTWHFEHAVLVGLLATVWAATGCGALEAIGAAAVYCTHGTASIGARWQEKDAQKARPDVSCGKFFWVYYAAKEALWLAYFLLGRNWSALVGCVFFALYPVWRAAYRRWIKPL